MITLGKQKLNMNDIQTEWISLGWLKSVDSRNWSESAQQFIVQCMWKVWTRSITVTTTTAKRSKYCAVYKVTIKMWGFFRNCICRTLESNCVCFFMFVFYCSGWSAHGGRHIQFAKLFRKHSILIGKIQCNDS